MRVPLSRRKPDAARAMLPHCRRRCAVLRVEPARTVGWLWRGGIEPATMRATTQRSRRMRLTKSQAVAAGRGLEAWGRGDRGAVPAARLVRTPREVSAERC